MCIFILVTEEDFGGNVKYFRNIDDAYDYSRTIVPNSDIITFPNIENSIPEVYIFATESQFGGDVQCFRTLDEGQEYNMNNEHKSNRYDLDTVIMRIPVE
jgi:hypothetical protein